MASKNQYRWIFEDNPNEIPQHYCICGVGPFTEFRLMEHQITCPEYIRYSIRKTAERWTRLLEKRGYVER